MYSSIMHSIKHRGRPNNEFTTPVELAKLCIEMVPLQPGDIVLDPALGTGVFYDNYPKYVEKLWNDRTNPFMLHDPIKSVDWIITNPPYSNLDAWFYQSCQVCRKGFAYLLGLINLTPRRIKIANEEGFGLSKMHLCKVYEWFGITCFVIFQKDTQNIIDYDRKVWRVL